MNDQERQEELLRLEKKIEEVGGFKSLAAMEYIAEIIDKKLYYPEFKTQTIYFISKKLHGKSYATIRFYLELISDPFVKKHIHKTKFTHHTILTLRRKYTLEDIISNFRSIFETRKSDAPLTTITFTRYIELNKLNEDIDNVREDNIRKLKDIERRLSQEKINTIQFILVFLELVDSKLYLLKYNTYQDYLRKEYPNHKYWNSAFICNFYRKLISNPIINSNRHRLPSVISHYIEISCLDYDTQLVPAILKLIDQDCKHITSSKIFNILNIESRHVIKSRIESRRLRKIAKYVEAGDNKDILDRVPTLEQYKEADEEIITNALLKIRYNYRWFDIKSFRTRFNDKDIDALIDNIKHIINQIEPTRGPTTYILPVEPNIISVDYKNKDIDADVVVEDVLKVARIDFAKPQDVTRHNVVFKISTKMSKQYDIGIVHEVSNNTKYKFTTYVAPAFDTSLSSNMVLKLKLTENELYDRDYYSIPALDTTLPLGHLAYTIIKGEQYFYSRVYPAFEDVRHYAKPGSKCLTLLLPVDAIMPIINKYKEEEM